MKEARAEGQVNSLFSWGKGWKGSSEHTPGEGICHGLSSFSRSDVIWPEILPHTTLQSLGKAKWECSHLTLWETVVQRGEDSQPR